MGSPKTELGYGSKRYDDEDEVSVTLTSGFWLGETELTQGQWQKLMGTTPWKEQTYVKEGDDYAASYINRDDAVELFEAIHTPPSSNASPGDVSRCFSASRSGT